MSKVLAGLLGLLLCYSASAQQPKPDATIMTVGQAHALMTQTPGTAMDHTAAVLYMGGVIHSEFFNDDQVCAPQGYTVQDVLNEARELDLVLERNLANPIDSYWSDKPLVYFIRYAMRKAYPCTK